MVTPLVGIGAGFIDDIVGLVYHKPYSTFNEKAVPALTSRQTLTGHVVFTNWFGNEVLGFYPGSKQAVELFSKSAVTTIKEQGKAKGVKWPVAAAVASWAAENGYTVSYGESCDGKQSTYNEILAELKNAGYQVTLDGTWFVFSNSFSSGLIPDSLSNIIPAGLTTGSNLYLLLFIGGIIAYLLFRGKK